VEKMWNTCGFLAFFPQPDWEKSVFPIFHRLDKIEDLYGHWWRSIFPHLYTLYYY